MKRNEITGKKALGPKWFVKPPPLGGPGLSQAMVVEQQIDAGYTARQTFRERGALRITTHRWRCLRRTDHWQGGAYPEAARAPCRRWFQPYPELEASVNSRSR